MIKRYILRVVSRSYGLHLFAPLAIFLVVEVFAGLLSQEVRDARSLMAWKEYFLSAHVWKGLIAVYVTFLSIVIYLIGKEGAIQITDIGAVSDALRGATSYFAVSPTSVREWFDPAAQAYLALVVGHRITHPTLRHERVQLFFAAPELENALVSQLDGHHAKCFSAWHEYLGVPLGFLKPDDILELLKALPPDQRRLICGRALESSYQRV